MRFPTHEVAAPVRTTAKATSAEAVQLFIRWFESAGRFIYSSRAEAATVWTSRGIKTLDAAPEGAAEALAGWVAAEPQKDRTYGSYGATCCLCRAPSLGQVCGRCSGHFATGGTL